LDLRSWRLPDGGSEALGKVDAKKLGVTSSRFEPSGRGWLYTVGTTTHFLPLPVGIAGDQLVSRHVAKVLFDPFGLLFLPSRPAHLSQHDESGENRLLLFPKNGPPVTTILPRPASAPPGVWATTSDRWVSGEPDEDAKLRLWNMKSLPGARPLELRRQGSWYGAIGSFHSAGNLVLATTHGTSRLTFWPVPQRPSIVIDGYKQAVRPVAFGPDGKWLATGWGWADGRLRLWPLPGNGSTDVKVLNAPASLWAGLTFDPNGKYLFAVGNSDNAWIVPLDGSPGRKLDAYSTETLLWGAAVSPTGRRVATAFYYGKGPKTLRVWDVETDKARVFELPVPPPPSATPPTLTGYEGGVSSLAFLDDSTLFTAGDGGIRRWNLDTGKHELIRSVPHGSSIGNGSIRDSWISMSSDHHELLFCASGPLACGAVDLSTGASRDLPGFGRRAGIASPPVYPQVTTQGPLFALLEGDGLVRVGLRSGGEPHWLVGHEGMTNSVAISPDLRWVASTGEDNTLRLWSMPDLSKPPLHTLPHAELVAKLKSLTNLRAFRDPASATGWKIDLGPFPGWKNLPSLEP
jgi:WD40 repeat protein